VLGGYPIELCAACVVVVVGERDQAERRELAPLLRTFAREDARRRRYA
jgi:hypothetical protein